MDAITKALQVIMNHYINNCKPMITAVSDITTTYETLHEEFEQVYIRKIEFKTPTYYDETGNYCDYFMRESHRHFKSEINRVKATIPENYQSPLLKEFCEVNRYGWCTFTLRYDLCESLPHSERSGTSISHGAGAYQSHHVDAYGILIEEEWGFDREWEVQC